ncbi:MAG: LysR substrate-binding domain-containing protein [Rhodospirillaceae bacterium]
MGLDAGVLDGSTDLNDFYYFAKIVEHRGFSSAAEALGVPKSRLSRRLAALEARLGVQLLQRSTRRFALTEPGNQLVRRCTAMLAELESGVAELSELRAHPKGILRIGCSRNAARVFLGCAVTAFLDRYPDVQAEVQVVSHDVNLYEHNIDLVLRVTPSIENGRYIAKRLWRSPQQLVASPALLARYPRIATPADLAALPTLDLMTRRTHAWLLHGPDGATVEHVHHPRLVSDDLEVLHQAALRGAGVARLPTLVCAQDVDSGALCPVLKNWHMEPRQLYAVFLSRPGLSAAARLFIDYLGEWFEAQPDWQAAAMKGPRRSDAGKASKTESKSTAERTRSRRAA